MAAILGIYASQISGHLYDGPYGAYDALASIAVGSGGVSSVSFNGIPSGYKHLQVRGILRSSYVPSNTNIRLTFNSDTANNYAAHDLTGNGSSATAGSESSNSSIGIARGAYDGLTAGVFTAFVIDILDYANTSKYKTTRTLMGYESNSEGQVGIRSGLWQSTNAVTSMNIFSNVGNLTQYSSFALYGVK